MRKLLFGIALMMAVPVSVIAGPKEEAYQVVEKFKRAFDASNVQGIVNLFAPDAVFLGTVSPSSLRKPMQSIARLPANLACGVAWRNSLTSICLGSTF